MASPGVVIVPYFEKRLYTVDVDYYRAQTFSFLVFCWFWPTSRQAGTDNYILVNRDLELH